MNLLLIRPLSGAVLSHGDVWKALHDASVTVIDERLGAFQSIAVVVAAMLAAWSLVHTAIEWVKDGERALGQLLAPIAILLCVMNFTVISGAFDGVVNLFGGRIAAAAGSSIGDMTAKVEEAARTGGLSVQEDWQADVVEAGGDSFAERLYNRIRGAFEFAAKTWTKTSELTRFSLVTFVCRFVIDLMFLVFQIIAAMFLTILRLIGPFAVALSATQRWRGGVVSWAERYIETSMWMPIGYIVIGILTGLYGAIATAIASGGVGRGAFFIGAAMIFASFRAIRSIPEIAGWLIAGTAHGLQPRDPLAVFGLIRKGATRT